MRQKRTWLPRMLMSGALLVLAGCGGNYQPAPLPPETPPAQPVAAPAPTPEPVMVTEKADVGSGAKGHDYGPGMITTPVSAYFVAKEKIAFQIQVPQALQLYKAQHGKGPQNWDEFAALMKANNIRLPELPEGHKYVYDPQAEELQVSHPQK